MSSGEYQVELARISNRLGDIVRTIESRSLKAVVASIHAEASQAWRMLSTNPLLKMDEFIAQCDVAGAELDDLAANGQLIPVPTTFERIENVAAPLRVLRRALTE